MVCALTAQLLIFQLRFVRRQNSHGTVTTDYRSAFTLAEPCYTQSTFDHTFEEHTLIREDKTVFQKYQTYAKDEISFSKMSEALESQ